MAKCREGVEMHVIHNYTLGALVFEVKNICFYGSFALLWNIKAVNIYGGKIYEGGVGEYRFKRKNIFLKKK